MKMQDKEFDDLFQSKLDSFEIEPSAQVWQNINAELDGKKKVRSILPWLSIAASVVILIVAGVLFLPKKTKNDTDRPKNKLTHIVVKAPAAKPDVTEPVIKPEIKNEQVAATQLTHKQPVKVHHAMKLTVPVEQSTIDNQLTAKTETVKTGEQQVLAVVETKKTDEGTSPVTININPETLKKADINETPEVNSQPVLASTQLPPAQTAKPIAKKRGIRNIGDLVNLVVTRVDKRKDKVIEFTDNDDDESMITGVHIGAVRIKKDN